MKKLFILASIFFLLNLSLYAKKYRTRFDGKNAHEGFYAAVDLGIAHSSAVNKNYTAAWSYEKAKVYNIMKKAEWSGNGFVSDFKIGWAVADNLIVHGTAICLFSHCDGEEPNLYQKNGISFAERMFGAGATYYFYPKLYFVSFSAGSTSYSLNGNWRDVPTVKPTEIKNGFGYQIAGGMTWWNDRSGWGNGFSLSYINTSGHARIPFFGDLDNTQISLSYHLIYN